MVSLTEPSGHCCFVTIDSVLFLYSHALTATMRPSRHHLTAHFAAAASCQLIPCDQFRILHAYLVTPLSSRYCAYELW